MGNKLLLTTNKTANNWDKSRSLNKLRTTMGKKSEIQKKMHFSLFTNSNCPYQLYERFFSPSMNETFSSGPCIHLRLCCHHRHPLNDTHGFPGRSRYTKTEREYHGLKLMWIAKQKITLRKCKNNLFNTCSKANLI